MSVPWAIATSGRIETAGVNLRALGVDPDKNVVVTRDQVRFAKPDPDLFVEAARRLEVPIEHAVVVGDSVWDMLAAARCRALGVGRSEEHTSELQSLMRISYAVFCLKKKKTSTTLYCQRRHNAQP